MHGQRWRLLVLEEGIVQYPVIDLDLAHLGLNPFPHPLLQRLVFVT